MLNLSTAATITQLVSAAISNAKTARDIAKDSTDHALKHAISDLYDALLDVKDRALELDEENRALKAEIARKGEFVGPLEPHGYFFRKEELDKPLCPKCFQSTPQSVVYLSNAKEWNGGIRRDCVICRYSNMEESMRLEPVRMGRIRPYMR